MIQLSQRAPDIDAVPQAIFWRPIRYFCSEVRQEVDDLDEFQFACFSIGNVANLEIRTYRGHNDQTATLFLSQGGDADVIAEAINMAISELQLPLTAVAWRRGMPFVHGELDRPRRDRLREREARNLMLKIAATMPGHRALMAEIRSQLPRYFELTAEDARISVTRRNEPLWHQIVRNVRSHKDSEDGPFRRGLALMHGEAFTVTEKGLAHLKSIGFLSP